MNLRAAEPSLVAVWYVLTLSAVGFVPLCVLVHRVLADRAAPPLLWVATTFGVIAGVSQTLGFLRWPFLVPYLAQAYLAPGPATPSAPPRRPSSRPSTATRAWPSASTWAI